MRFAIILPALLLIAACSLSKDPNDNSVTLGYDNGAAENGAKIVTTEAGKSAGDIATDVKERAQDQETSEQSAAARRDNAAANETATSIG